MSSNSRNPHTEEWISSWGMHRQLWAPEWWVSTGCFWLQVRGHSTPSGFVIRRWVIQHSENPEGRQFQNWCLCSSCPHAKIFAHPLDLWSHGHLWLWMQETPRPVLCPPLLCGFGEARGAYIIAHKCSTSLWLKSPFVLPSGHSTLLSSSLLSLLFHPQIPALLLNAQQFNLTLTSFLLIIPHHPPLSIW